MVPLSVFTSAADTPGVASSAVRISFAQLPHSTPSTL
jgi:hypothetical protein